MMCQSLLDLNGSRVVLAILNRPGQFGILPSVRCICDLILLCSIAAEINCQLVAVQGEGVINKM